MPDQGACFEEPDHKTHIQLGILLHTQIYRDPWTDRCDAIFLTDFLTDKSKSFQMFKLQITWQRLLGPVPSQYYALRAKTQSDCVRGCWGAVHENPMRSKS